ncbi:MAG: hypothetical protein KGH78_03960, partial [Candidatus Micrarchaeota archaeon]|nr:hypothetical protein [Candidatus Micrarchaeota archaeon]
GMTILMIFFLVSVYSMLAYSSATERLYVLVAMTVITVAFMAAIARIGKRLQILYRVVPLVLIALFFVVLMNIDWVYASSITQADSINYGFISAMQWMGSNTPSNSVALTLWPDGSVVEGVANRTSITDSVGSQKYWIANPFAVWMFNSSKDPQFMLLNISSRPDYMVARYSWFAETSGIYLESGLNLSSSQFAYLLFTDFQEKVTPAIQNFSFASSAQPGLLAHLTIYNGTSYFGYLENSKGISPFADIILYDTVNGSYTELPQHYSATNNNTFVMVYSSIPRPGVPINVSYAYTMNYGIAHSNLFRVLYECGANACAWNNTIAGLRLVYANQDTKIFRIVYNATS